MSKPIFQQIYLEITNCCNLHCPFCPLEERSKKVMSLEQFRIITKKIKPYTDSIYLHVKGEPLLHPEFKEIIKICEEANVKVKITTNGTLLSKYQEVLLNSPIIKRINISLQSASYLSPIEQKNYFDQLALFIKENTHKHIYLRMWALDDKKRTSTMQLLEACGIEDSKYLHYSYEEQFTWPSLDEAITPPTKCLGGKNQLGVLVDGTVTLCCLDQNGLTNLGNLLTGEMEDILASEKYMLAVEKMPYLEICKHCSYRLRFKKGGMKSS